jgi:hypothetical protein
MTNRVAAHLQLSCQFRLDTILSEIIVFQCQFISKSILGHLLKYVDWENAFLFTLTRGEQERPQLQQIFLIC